MREYIGRNVVVYYEDIGKVSRHNGVLVSIAPEGYVIRTNGGYEEIIPAARVIRIVLNGAR